MRVTAILLGLVTFVSVSRAELEFIGYTKTANESKFVLRDVGEKKNSKWLNLGDTFESYTLVSFDKKSEILSLQSGAVTVKLRLKSAHALERDDISEFRKFFSREGT